MPELPEVETVRRGLQPVLEGQRIAQALVRRDGLRWPFPQRMAERLTGTTVTGLTRRAKYLLASLDSGETLIVHLGMSGRMLVSGVGLSQFVHQLPTPEKHDHVVLEIETGACVTFNDARRFGMMDLVATECVHHHPLLAGLGPEPLGNDFNALVLATAFAGRKSPIKSALLDQTIVAGLGNIYVCEALWRAGINPLRLAGEVGPVDLLVRVIREVLSEAIEAGGASLRDHRQTNGELGYFQHSFSVYGHEGRPCRTLGCSGIVGRIVQAGRSTFYCEKCQIG